MGEVEIKKFIALLALANLSDDKPLELLHLSLVRAKFCDLVGAEKNIGNNPPTAFLVGLFSMLDALLDQKMETLLEKMPLVDEVKDALCGEQNDLSIFLLLVKAFESGKNTFTLSMWVYLNQQDASISEPSIPDSCNLEFFSYGDHTSVHPSISYTGVENGKNKLKLKLNGDNNSFEVNKYGFKSLEKLRSI